MKNNIEQVIKCKQPVFRGSTTDLRIDYGAKNAFFRESNLIPWNAAYMYYIPTRWYKLIFVSCPCSRTLKVAKVNREFSSGLCNKKKQCCTMYIVISLSTKYFRFIPLSTVRFINNRQIYRKQKFEIFTAANASLREAAMFWHKNRSMCISIWIWTSLYLLGYYEGNRCD